MHPKPRNLLEAIASGNENEFVATLCEPTQACPGSEEKVNVIASRLLLGQELFHAQDFCEHGPATHHSNLHLIFHVKLYSRRHGGLRSID
jgi:hypothetical protein